MEIGNLGNFVLGIFGQVGSDGVEGFGRILATQGRTLADAGRIFGVIPPAVALLVMIGVLALFIVGLMASGIVSVKIEVVEKDEKRGDENKSDKAIEETIEEKAASESNGELSKDADGSEAGIEGAINNEDGGAAMAEAVVDEPIIEEGVTSEDLAEDTSENEAD